MVVECGVTRAEEVDINSVSVVRDDGRVEVRVVLLVGSQFTPPIYVRLALRFLLSGANGRRCLGLVVGRRNQRLVSLLPVLYVPEEPPFGACPPRGVRPGVKRVDIIPPRLFRGCNGRRPERHQER